MKFKEGQKSGLGVLGLGAAACAACCAGPILAFLGGLSLAGLVSASVFGTAGIVLAVGAATSFVIVRRNRPTCALSEPELVAVASPVRKSSGG